MLKIKRKTRFSRGPFISSHPVNYEKKVIITKVVESRLEKQKLKKVLMP